MKRITSVVIVGGGSSGWMTAAYLSKFLFDVSCTLIESKSTPTIGVGEATVPFLGSFLNRIGFSDSRLWMPECDATFKCGIRFENWLKRGDWYWHPFEYLDYVDFRHHIGHCWLYWHRTGGAEFASRHSFYRSFFPST